MIPIRKIADERLALLLAILIFAGLQGCKQNPEASKSAAAAQQALPAAITAPASNPYQDETSNLIYNMLFCDNLELYRRNVQPPYTYPLNILLAPSPAPEELQKIVGDSLLDSRMQLLAVRRLQALGQPAGPEELLAVIVEIGLDNGPDVLASFRNGTARYINQTGKMLIWDITTDAAANQLNHTLFQHGRAIIAKIGTSADKRRKPFPAKGQARITLLTTAGMGYGEGPVEVLFNDPMAHDALEEATELMHYLTTKGQPGAGSNP